MTLRRGIAVTPVVCVLWVAACTVATPSRTPVPTGSASAATAATPSPAVTSPARSREPREGLSAALDVQSLDPALTHPLLEFATDGESIIFSSGIAPDSGAEAAPDLWRFVPGPSAVPELIWRNPDRDHSLVKVGGDLGTLAFVDIPLTGERAWDLWLIPGVGAEPILLDSHPGDEEVSSLVPSFSVYEPRIAWTAFDRGPGGPVSQLLVAEAPDWEPVVVAERLASEAELWLPSLYGLNLVYAEVRYAADRGTDERSVHLLDLGDPDGAARRLDASGRATMPLIIEETVVWKEADPGFNMFNWGKMFRYDLATDELSSMSVWPQEYVNHPSVGSRFVAWWGANAFKFGVYDLVRQRARLIESYSPESQDNVLRPNVSGDFLVWLYVAGDAPGGYSELRWTSLPNPKESDR